MMKIFFIIALLFSLNSFSAVNGETHEYQSGGKTMQGYVARDTSLKNTLPAILIVHDWMGPSSFTEEKAKKLAKMGYFAMAVDIYGKGVRPKNATEAGQLATQYKNDRALLQSRMKDAYDDLIKIPAVDKNQIIVMGYCFGGTSALELARTGVELAGVVSFHGGLANPNPSNAKNIKGSVLILHGGDDPMVPPTEVEAFRTEMAKANKRFEMISYPGAVHAFTNPGAGNDPKKGAAYNEKADKASWLAFEKFLTALKPPKK